MLGLKLNHVSKSGPSMQVKSGNPINAHHQTQQGLRKDSQSNDMESYVWPLVLELDPWNAI